MTLETILVPDLGGVDQVTVIELCCEPGDKVEKEGSLIVLESDKATMDVPSSCSGTLHRFLVGEGDEVSAGDELAEVEMQGLLTSSPAKVIDLDDINSVKIPVPKSSREEPETAKATVLYVPDTGNDEDLVVTEIFVVVGDDIEEDDSLVMLESDKASIEVPSTSAGKITEVLVNENDKIRRNEPVVKIQIRGDVSIQSKSVTEDDTQLNHRESNDAITDADLSERDTFFNVSQKAPAKKLIIGQTSSDRIEVPEIYAGPSVRLLSRELGVDLSLVRGSGLRGRITREDLNDFVQNQLSASSKSHSMSYEGDAEAHIDFAQFGPIETNELTKIQLITAQRLQESWTKIPHVTQFDDAEITELEAFRKSLNSQSKPGDSKVTLIAFLLKAVCNVLKNRTQFNRSLVNAGKSFVQKNYFHIGIAVDTAKGLLVPVIQNVDSKGILQLAEEAAHLALKARDGQLTPNEMRGGCFTISSLGAKGGTGFTPIINPPEVAILGVAKAKTQPYWDGDGFTPKLYLPLALSYDHRIINGADGGAFMGELTRILSDIRLLAL